MCLLTESSVEEGNNLSSWALGVGAEAGGGEAGGYAIVYRPKYSIIVICIGSNIWPISGICPVRNGKTIPIAINIADTTNFLTVIVIS